MKKNLINYLYLLAIGSLTLGACKKEVEGLGSEPGKAKILFVNATVNAATSRLAGREMGIYPFYNGTQFNNTPIKFRSTNGYKAFAPGQMTIRLDTALSFSTNPPGPREKVVEITFSTQPDTYYSLFSVGTTQNVDTLLLRDDLSLPTAGKAKVRIMNLSPDTGPVDVVITAKNGVTLTPPLVLGTQLAYKGVKAFFELDPGNYTMEMRVAGTATTIPNTSRANIIIDANSCYSIWTAGYRPAQPAGVPVGQAVEIRYHANRWSNPLVP